jgi:O-antigen ligase
MKDSTGLLTADSHHSPWRRLQDGYAPWVFRIAAIFVLLFAFFAPDKIALLVFALGVLLLLQVRYLKAMIVPAVLTGLLLLLGFARSDFIDFLRQGMDIGAAYHKSIRYFQAPMLEWLAAWAAIMAAWRLSPERAKGPMTWLMWAFAALAVIQLLDTVSFMGLRNAINNQYFGGHRPEMVVVLVSDSNAVLELMFWPMAWYLVERRNYAVLWGAVAAIIGCALVVDTNAQVLAMLAAFIVFMAARHWPAVWRVRGLRPERILAVLAGGFVLVFPPLILWAMRSGLAQKIKTDILPSWGARIDIWSFATDKALEKPLWGWGFESARNFAPIIPDHPHNMSLQAWLELGIPGLVLLGLFWFFAFWLMPGTGQVAVRRDELIEIGAEPVAASDEPSHSDPQPYWLAAATTFYLINTISYGLWRDWFYCMGALSVIVAFLAVRSVRAAREPV